MNQIKVEKTFRYKVVGNLETARHIIYALHGYGQLIHFFSRKFNSIINKETAVVCPEGMHRFYLKGSSGRVGASWMTKEAREIDIEDNIHFLDMLNKEITAKSKIKKITVLGFSQGGATAARWVQLGSIRTDNFVLWASVFPPDLKEIHDHSKFDLTQNFFVVGDKDEYFSEENILKTKQDFSSKELAFEFIHFNGDHNIYDAPLKELFAKL